MEPKYHKFTNVENMMLNIVEEGQEKVDKLKKGEK